MWDVIVVGTGMGGATLGLALAKTGARVLFVEKGIVDRSGEGGIRGVYPEASPDFFAHRDECLLQAGRSIDEIADGGKSFTPFIGTGGGGSSALFGMVMERFFREDFTPRANHRDAASTLPEAWPVGYDEMAPWYGQAEAMYHVRGSADPLRNGDDIATLRPPLPLSIANIEIASALRRQGMHPYDLHLACDDMPGCNMCEGVLCPRACKRDAATTCLLPALREHGAEVLDRATVVGLQADRTRVTGVVTTRDGETRHLRARHVVLAAGALMTPAILLHSTSQAWPRGIANRSDQVGRNLMRHTMEFFFLRNAPHTRDGVRAKGISASDFYLAGEKSEGRKLGTLQSLERLPGSALILGGLPAALRAIGRPLMNFWWENRFRSLSTLAAIMEDLPLADNRVVPGDPFDSGMRQHVRIHYRLSAYDLTRAATFHRIVMRTLKPLKPHVLNGKRRNSAIAHVCGTCRFGDDPATSVLDAHNRAHDLDNLYVVDASFFPSSSGTNPALTIAANALRVAAHLRERL